MSYYEKELMITGDKDTILKQIITLACYFKWERAETAESWKVNPDVGLTFYRYHSPGQDRFPTPIDSDGMFHIAKSWLASPVAQQLRDVLAPEGGGDGSYDIGWKIETDASVDNRYSQLFTLSPYRIYYGK